MEWAAHRPLAKRKNAVLVPRRVCGVARFANVTECAGLLPRWKLLPRLLSWIRPGNCAGNLALVQVLINSPNSPRPRHSAPQPKRRLCGLLCLSCSYGPSPESASLRSAETRHSLRSFAWLKSEMVQAGLNQTRPTRAISLIEKYAVECVWSLVCRGLRCFGHP